MSIPEPKPLDVEQLRRVPLQDLAQNAQIREQEMKQLQLFLQQLHVGYDRFRQSKNVLDQLALQENGRQVMIPLTQSLYVPGEVDDLGTVLVDIGTGYYVKKSNEEAKRVLERRMAVVKDSIEKLSKSVAFKQAELEKIKRVITYQVEQRQKQISQQPQQQQRQQ